MGDLIRLRIPKDIDITIDGGQDKDGHDVEVTRPFRFVKDFVVRHVLNDKRWIQSTDWTFAGMEIRGLFQGAKEGEIVRLTSDQFKKLKECVETPSGGWSIVPQVMFQLRDYIDALLTPVKEEPAKVLPMEPDAKVA